jgi:putative transposase
LLEEYAEILAQVKVLWVDGGYSGDGLALAVWLMIQARVEVIQRQGPRFEVTQAVGGGTHLRLAELVSALK